MSSMLLSSVLVLSINPGLYPQVFEHHNESAQKRVEKLERQVKDLSKKLTSMERVVKELQSKFDVITGPPAQVSQREEAALKASPAIKRYRLSSDATKSLTTALDLLYGDRSIVRYSVDPAGNILITIVGR